MFLDGVTYAAIARNMAESTGSLWQAHYTQTLYPVFYEHPPLAIGIQSIFFKAFGDSIYIERIYSLLSALLTAIGISLCWRSFFQNNVLRHFSWLPILLWISIPIVFWTFRNNMLENTMGIFTIFAIYFSIRSIQKNNFLFMLIAALLTLAAFFCKGPVGLFPISVPFLYLLVFPNMQNKKGILLTIVFIVFFIISAGLLFLIIPESLENIRHYLEQQVFPAVQNKREVNSNNRFNILGKLLLEMSFPIILSAFFLLRNRIQTKSFNIPYINQFIFFLLLGLSASVPLIITLKQHKYYIQPSIPLFMLAFSMLLLPFVAKLIEKINVKTAKLSRFFLILFFLSILVFSIHKINHFSRNQDKIEDINKIAKNYKKGSVFSCSTELWNDWSLHAYLIRHAQISIDCNSEHTYYICEKSNKPNNRQYKDLVFSGNRYYIFKREN